MLGQSKIAVILGLVALAFLPIRMAHAHLHLRLDGQERPVSMHFEDVPTHHGAVSVPSGHNDFDVDVPTSVSIKKANSTDELSPAILGAYIVAVLLPEYAAVVPSAEVADPAPVVVFDLRPPTRGPPA